MKLLVISFAIMGALAELPRFRPARFRFQRQELAPSTTDSSVESTTDSTSGPYPPSGWRPTGAQFTLPQDTTVSPTDTYGPPAESGPYPPSGWKPEGQAFTLPQDMTPPAESYGTHGTPENTYGVPENSYGPPSTDSTTTDTSQSEKLDGPVEVQKSIGTYYVLLPNGQLQRVEFVTENDIQNMKYTARLELRDRAPLYLFGP